MAERSHDHWFPRLAMCQLGWEGQIHHSFINSLFRIIYLILFDRQIWARQNDESTAGKLLKCRPVHSAFWRSGICVQYLGKVVALTAHTKQNHMKKQAPYRHDTVSSFNLWWSHSRLNTECHGTTGKAPKMDKSFWTSADASIWPWNETKHCICLFSCCYPNLLLDENSCLMLVGEHKQVSDNPG